jgi:tRNA-splicing ligase RtcB (3'-phosphate/5'-hydroxy nucleic acid ligase)
MNFFNHFFVKKIIMGKLKLRAQDLRSVGYENARIIQTVMMLAGKHYKTSNKEDVLPILENVFKNPSDFLEDNAFAKVAEMILEMKTNNGTLDGVHYDLRADAVECNTFGAAHIEDGALKQINIASRLPIAVAAALMPDAHQGYGLPIGGVLATKNAVIPYGVGVDIGCRMCLSIFDIEAAQLSQKIKNFTEILLENTKFGAGGDFQNQLYDHEVLENPLFNEDKFVKDLQYKAMRQLGSSGSGNHFVEFGIVEIGEKDATLGVKKGRYVGLLSHSGSRGLGATIANHYTKIAMQTCRLPQEARHLAWLDLESEQGAAYWAAMNLAGDYASACHEVIHLKIAKALGEKPLKMVENHHNFAWKEVIDGQELIVHRKGATPAARNELGIIPGSMATPGFIVKGKGLLASLQSASHGAGRKFSRTKALETITMSSLKEMLKKNDVKLLGGGLDEAPQAYKDINEVMQAQQNLVEIVGTFYPKIVRMDG